MGGERAARRCASFSQLFTVGRSAQAGCVLARLFRLAWLWSAYWRLYPLWHLLRQAVPEIELPREVGLRWNIRYRLYRRVIEIRDAQLILWPYSSTAVAGLAAAMARESGLPSDKAAAIAEAALIRSALRSRVHGSVCCHNRAPENHFGAVPGNDIRAEAARLILMCRAIHRSRIVRRIAGPPPGRRTMLGRMADRATKLLVSD